MISFVRDKQVRKNIFSNVQNDATTIAVAIEPIGVLNPSMRKFPTGKLLSIFVSETIKTSILPFTWVERNSNLFLTEFMFIWAKISLFELSLRNAFKTLQSFACATLDTWDLHSSRLTFEMSFSCQLKTWDSCLIKVSFSS